MDDSCPPPLTVSTSDFLVNAAFNVFVNSVNSNYVSSGRGGGGAARPENEAGQQMSYGSGREGTSDTECGSESARVRRGSRRVSLNCPFKARFLPSAVFLFNLQRE